MNPFLKLPENYLVSIFLTILPFLRVNSGYDGKVV